MSGGSGLSDIPLRETVRTARARVDEPRLNMRWRTVGSVFIAVAVFARPAHSQSINWTLEEFQPNIPYGGRTNTIAVNPSDNRIMFVASESGGLFITKDSGTHWNHVDALAAYYTSAIAYVTSDILIATTADRFSVGNDAGGIWRSSDGGINWSHIASPTPPVVGWRFAADEISIAPDTGHIYVTTSFGLSKSSDQGVTWTVEAPFGIFSTASVAAQRGNLVVASSLDGRRSTNVARSVDGGATWTPTTFPVPLGDLHGLAASPLDDHTFYAYGDPDFYVSEDGGATWSRIAPTFSRGPQSDGPPWCGGHGFVKPLATSTGLTLWLGNRCDVAQLVAPRISGTSRFDYSGVPRVSSVDHSDSRDMAFGGSTPRMPILLATDGGVHRTLDGGLTWMLTGSGPNGYNALQIAEVKGQWIDNAGKYDLYLAIQDNGIWASGDQGVTWPPPSRGPEGLNLEMEKHVPSAPDSVVTAKVCGPCANDIGGRVFSQTYGAPFSGLNPWRNPPGRMVGPPATVSKSLHDQGVDASPPRARPRFQKGLAATRDLGTTWTQYAVVAEDLVDIPRLSTMSVAVNGRPLAVAVQYQAIRKGFDSTRDLEIDTLVRLTLNPKLSIAMEHFPAMRGFGGIGINPPDWFWHRVFGVDPKDSKHLIAPDVFSGKIMESHDGGENWSEILGLTSLLTDAGRYQFNSGPFPFASHVSFFRDDPTSVAIGTQQNGLILSRDRGATWIKVPNSERATAITSIEWMSATDAFVSTLGRGLWRLTGAPVVSSLPSLCAVQSCLLKYVFRGDPSPDRFERGIVVFEGEIMGARVEGGVLRELSVTPQTSIGFVGTTVKPAIRYTTQQSGLIGIAADEAFTTPSGRFLTGLALDARTGLVGALYTSAKIPLSEKSATRPNASIADGRVLQQHERSPALSKPYISMSAAEGTDNIGPGSPLTVTGERMPRSALLEIVLDGRVIEKAERHSSGSLNTTFKAPAEFGIHTLIVRDANSKRTIDGMSFVVRHRDSEGR